MIGRLKWVQSWLRKVIQDGESYQGCLVSSGLKAFSDSIRSLNVNDGKVSFRSYSTRERRRAVVVPKHLQSESGLKEALDNLNNHAGQGTTVDSYHYVNVLRGCSKQKDPELVKKVHDCIKKSGLEQNLFVANSLLKCYIRCGKFPDAQEVFNKLSNKDIVSWTTMIGGYADHDQAEYAIQVYKQMRNEGGQPDAVAYLALLKACASPAALKWGKDIHADIIQGGFSADVRVSNALLHMYANCGSVDDARKVFNQMAVRNVISWTAMIGGLAQHGHGHEAFSLFQRMQAEGYSPNSITYLSMFSARAGPEDLVWVRKVHSHAEKSGLLHDLFVYNALILIYDKCGSVDDAKLVFDTMTDRDVISWSTIIGGLARHGRGHEAFACFQQMLREGVAPDVGTYLGILNSNACDGALGWVKEVHSHAARSGLNADVRVSSALVHMYAKSGSIDDARVVFAAMEERDVVSWTSMIGGLAQHGLGQEAFSFFLQMQREGFKPDASTYLSILNSCSSTGSLKWVKEVHAQATIAGFDVELRVGNALVNMYSKAGSIPDARQVFDKMLDRDISSWTVMIGGLAQHGHAREALQLYEDMKEKGVKPTGHLFVSVLSACSHAGLVDEGRFQFVSMTRDYGMLPALKHYTCMVDVLGRAGLLDEAKLFTLNLPIKPDIVTWKALLSACRVHNHTKLAELVANKCMELEPTDPCPYVLLSNLYASAGDWDQVSLIRSMMQERGIRKDPGLCWIEVGNKVHHFVSGDKSHPEAREIYAMLNRLSEEMKSEGYIPDTRLVLRNIDEDKQSAVCFHSEKLAMAYGLLHVTNGEAIRIYKNLRMCTDCHTATKFISRIARREIVARDANRFHHFKDGLCSCGDFW